MEPDSVQSLADEYYRKIKDADNLGPLKEALLRAQWAALSDLAAAMRKTLPEAMIEDIIVRANPLGAFLDELRKEE